MKTTVALVGAGGKMGTRLRRRLAVAADVRLLCCETAQPAAAVLRAEGLTVLPGPEALGAADVTVFAVPDALMGRVTAALVPQAKRGAVMILLDPAAAVAGEVAVRDDLHYVVCHPCHPPLFGDQPNEEARRDFFGGIAATQDIVIANMAASEEAFDTAEALCRTMFAPVADAHRVTVDQMAILEPAMAEVCAAAAAVLMKEALEEAVRRGVPRAAARSFMMGHAQIPLAIVFGAIDSPFSDAAKVAVEFGKRHLWQPTWRDVFEPAKVRACIREMLHPEQS